MKQQYNQEIDEIKRLFASHDEMVLPRYLQIRDIVKTDIGGWPEFQIPIHQIEMCLIWYLDQAAITLTNHLVEKFLKTILIYHNTNYQVPEENIIQRIKIGCHDAIEKYDKMDLTQTIDAACTQGLILKEDKVELYKICKSLRNPYSHAQQKTIHGDLKMPLVGASFDSEMNMTLHPKQEIKISEIMPVSGLVIQMHAEANSIPYFKYVFGLIYKTLPKIIPKDNEDI